MFEEYDILDLNQILIVPCIRNIDLFKTSKCVCVCVICR